MSGYLDTIIAVAAEHNARGWRHDETQVRDAIRAVCEGRAFMGSGEICAAYSISRTQLGRWRAEPGFPRPVADLAQGPVWDAHAVQAWHAQRFPGRP